MGLRRGIVRSQVVQLLAVMALVGVAAPTVQAAGTAGTTAWAASGSKVITPDRVLVRSLADVTASSAKAALPKPLVREQQASPTPRSPAATPHPLRGSSDHGIKATQLAAASSDVQIVDSFTGIASTGYSPPDVSVAADATYVIEMVNLQGRIWTKATGQNRDFPLKGFFLASGDSLSDPRVIYDTQSGRWFATVMDLSTLGVKLAVSASGDPTGSWSVYSIPSSFPTSTCPDQPRIGVGDQAFVITVNAFPASACSGDSGPQSAGAKVWVITKADLTAGATINPIIFGEDARFFGIQPAQSVSSSNTVYMASIDEADDSTIDLFSVVGAPTPSMTIPVSRISIAPYPITVPPPATQQGTGITLDTGDNRVQDAVFQNGTLTVAANDRCTPPGDSATRSCGRVIRIATSSDAVMNSGEVTYPGFDAFYPALRPDAAGNADVIFGYSSSSDYPSLAVATFGADGSWSPSSKTLVKGTGPVTDGRYGDYFGAATDPSDPNLVWVGGELGIGGGVGTDWRTEVASIRFGSGPPPTGVALQFQAQPGAGVAGAVLASQPAVRIVDSSGSTVTTGPSSTAAVTLAISTNPGGGTLSCAGGLTVAAIAGVASFGGCSISAAGVGYVLSATSSGLSSAASAPFTVSAPAMPALQFQAQPEAGVAGAALTPEPAVQVVDSSGNTMTTGPSSTAPVTLAIATNPGGGTLSCSGGLTVAAVAGVATFAGCSISAAGADYVLSAASGGLSSARSAPFTVSAPAMPALQFRVQPSSGTVGVAFAAQPVVRVTTPGGATIATGPQASAQISLALGANPGGATLTCTGGTTRAAMAGIASFGGCALNAPGSGYTIVASSPGMSGATSVPFSITAGSPGSTAINLAASASAIGWGAGVTLTATIVAPPVASPGSLPGRTLQFMASADGHAWSSIGSGMTDQAGVAALTYRPAVNLFYEAVLAPSGGSAAGQSNELRVTVRQLALLRPDNGGRVVTVGAGTTITFVTTVRPASSQVGPGRVLFQLYVLSGEIWKLTQSTPVVPDAAGRASLTVTFKLKGPRFLRAMAQPTPTNANSTWTPMERYNVV
jgi:hypothetical protein